MASWLREKKPGTSKSPRLAKWLSQGLNHQQCGEGLLYGRQLGWLGVAGVSDTVQTSGVAGGGDMGGGGSGGAKVSDAAEGGAVQGDERKGDRHIKASFWMMEADKLLRKERRVYHKLHCGTR